VPRARSGLKLERLHDGIWALPADLSRLLRIFQYLDAVRRCHFPSSQEIPCQHCFDYLEDEASGLLVQAAQPPTNKGWSEDELLAIWNVGFLNKSFQKSRKFIGRIERVEDRGKLLTPQDECDRLARFVGMAGALRAASRRDLVTVTDWITRTAQYNHSAYQRSVPDLVDSDKLSPLEIVDGLLQDATLPPAAAVCLRTVACYLAYPEEPSPLHVRAVRTPVLWVGGASARIMWLHLELRVCKPGGCKVYPDWGRLHRSRWEEDLVATLEEADLVARSLALEEIERCGGEVASEHFATQMGCWDVCWWIEYQNPEGAPIILEGSSLGAAAAVALTQLFLGDLPDPRACIIAGLPNKKHQVTHLTHLTRVEGLKQKIGQLRKEAAALPIRRVLVSPDNIRDAFAALGDDPCSQKLEVKRVNSLEEAWTLTDSVRHGVIAYLENLSNLPERECPRFIGKHRRLRDLYCQPNVESTGVPPTSAVLSTWQQAYDRDQHKRIILEGDPGYGKTLITRMTACEVARKSLDDYIHRRTTLAEVKIPIWLRLADFGSKDGRKYPEVIFSRSIKRELSKASVDERKAARSYLAVRVQKAISGVYKHPCENFRLFLDGLDDVYGLNTMSALLNALHKQGYPFTLTSRPLEQSLQAVFGLLPQTDVSRYRLQKIDSKSRMTYIEKLFQPFSGEDQNEIFSLKTTY
jgi:hypothetical protein